jgi:hypothetical protein
LIPFADELPVLRRVNLPVSAFLPIRASPKTAWQKFKTLFSPVFFNAERFADYLRNRNGTLVALRMITLVRLPISTEPALFFCRGSLTEAYLSVIASYKRLHKSRPTRSVDTTLNAIACGGNPN